MSEVSGIISHSCKSNIWLNRRQLYSPTCLCIQSVVISHAGHVASEKFHCVLREGAWKGKKCLSMAGKMALTSQILWKGPPSPDRALRTIAITFSHCSSIKPYTPIKPDYSLSPKYNHIFTAHLRNKYFDKRFCLSGAPYGLPGYRDLV